MLLNLIGVYSSNAFIFLQVLLSCFFAILFLQSGLDKVTDRKGNLGWLVEHFAASPLAKMVPLLLTIITIVEVFAGLASAAGVLEVLVFRTFNFSSLGTALSGIALLMLFLGQRLAKDYAGAGGLVPYFIVVIVNLYILA